MSSIVQNIFPWSINLTPLIEEYYDGLGKDSLALIFLLFKIKYNPINEESFAEFNKELFLKFLLELPRELFIESKLIKEEFLRLQQSDLSKIYFPTLYSRIFNKIKQKPSIELIILNVLRIFTSTTLPINKRYFLLNTQFKERLDLKEIIEGILDLILEDLQKAFLSRNTKLIESIFYKLRFNNFKSSNYCKTLSNKLNYNLQIDLDKDANSYLLFQMLESIQECIVESLLASGLQIEILNKEDYQFGIDDLYWAFYYYNKIPRQFIFAQYNNRENSSVEG